MTWNEFVVWYDARPTYDATPEKVAVDKKLVGIATAGPDNYRLFADQVADLVRAYEAD